MIRHPLVWLWPIAGLMFGAAATAAPLLNGFVLDSNEIDVREIRSGGPPRDGIPALDHPSHGSTVNSLWDRDVMVIGVAWKDEARAYPIPILEWHELVNDTLGGRPILVSYCPLCGTGIVFDRRIGQKNRRFGVSGLLYRSDLLLYDRESESLWSQILATAVTGPAQGLRLALLRSRMMTLEQWRTLHPRTTVLVPETGHRRDYSRRPYVGYATSDRLMFPADYDRRYHPKMPTLGLRLRSGAARAYPATEVLRAGGVVEERFAGHAIRIAYDPEAQVFEVSAPPAVEIVEGYWFAWSAFHEETSVFVAPASE